MRRCVLDKIASVTKHTDLTRNAVLSAEIPAQAGTVIQAFYAAKYGGGGGGVKIDMTQFDRAIGN